MGLFQRKEIIDLTERSVSPTTDETPAAAKSRASLHAGVPGRCSECGGFGYIDHIDMVHRYQRQHCRTCGHVWEYTFDEAGDVVDLTEIGAGALQRHDHGIQI